MRVGGADQAGLEGAVTALLDVVGEAAPAAQKAIVLDALHSFAEPFRGHAG